MHLWIELNLLCRAVILNMDLVLPFLVIFYVKCFAKIRVGYNTCLSRVIRTPQAQNNEFSDKQLLWHKASLMIAEHFAFVDFLQGSMADLAARV